MKELILRIIVTVLATFAAFAMTGCNDRTGGTIDQIPEPPVSGESNLLIAYFSCSGNTQTIANYIQEETGGELYRILTVEPYPEDINELYQVGQRELNENARPELAEPISSEVFAGYDTVFIGYPIWGGTMPMAVYHFLESYDFTGKTVVPFCTHGGSGIGNTEATIRNICGEVTMLNGFSVYGSRVSTAQNAVGDWLQEIGL